jgi:putative SOS response-associated peptidase YedK
MCGRYSLFVDPDVIEDRFDITVEGYERRYNAAPGQSLPVITDERPETLSQFEWGLIPPWAERSSDGGHINARGETITEKPSFERAFEQTEPDVAGRCLVPADGFYEWVDVDGERQPVRITADDGVFAMAGLWAEWEPETVQTGLDTFGSSSSSGEGGDRSEVADPVRTFTIVTTEPNDLVDRFHHRMAVVLPGGEERDWLDRPSSNARELIEPYPSAEMEFEPVSRALNDPSNDSPALVEPVDVDIGT